MTSLERCPFCNTELPDSILATHIMQTHASARRIYLPDEPIGAGVGQVPTIAKHDDTRIAAIGDFNNSVDETDDWYESRDGSNGWSDFARDNGAFGSHPLFDDYGDESDAE